MSKLSNAQRAAMYKMLADARAPTRFGEVSSYDPDNYTAKVTIQPEETETGWLPILGQGLGAGFGSYYGLLPGMQVSVMHAEGDRDNGIIVGCSNNSVDAPPSVPGGEQWHVHQSGSFLKFTNDGNVALNAKQDLVATVGGKITATVQGDASVTCDGQLVVHCDDINLGGTGGKPVALDQDSVVSNKVVASSTKVKAL
jgi:phage baseplate assembly protein gpV